MLVIDNTDKRDSHRLIKLTLDGSAPVLTVVLADVVVAGTAGAEPGPALELRG